MNGEIERLDTRAKAAWSDALTHHSAYREAYRWLLPEAYARQTSGDGDNTNRALYDHIFDATGLQALEDGASQIAEALHPWDVPWARWAARDDVPDEQQGAVEEQADKLTKVCESLLKRSNFNTAAPVAHKDFLIGTAFLVIARDPFDQDRVRAQALPPWQWAIDTDDSGRVTGMFRKSRPRGRELAYLYEGATFSAATQKVIADPDLADKTRVDIMQAITWEPRKRLWEHCCYEVDAKHEVYCAEHRTPPVICYRSGVISGCAWGSGPGLKALPDVKVTNRVAELVLRNAALAMAGLWLADEDGLVNPRNVRLLPGSIIPKMKGSEGLTPIAPAGKFDVSSFVLDEYRSRILRAFYVTKVADREMTAEEYQGRKEQQLREMRGMYGQLRSEFAEQVMLRVLDLATEMGLVQQPEMDKMAEVLLVGPLAQDVAGAEVERFVKAVMTIAQVSGPEIAMAAVNLDAAVPWIARKLHADADLFKTSAQLQQFGQQVTQLAAQYHASAMAQAQPAKAQPQAVPQSYGALPPQSQAQALGVQA